MKIAITANNNDLDAPVDPRFGRAPGFIIYDTDTGASEFVDNAQNLSLAQGAGIQSAQNVAAAGVQAVLTGHVGPKAFHALDRGGIAVYLDAGTTVRQAVQAFVDGSASPAANPDKDGHW